MTSVAFSASLQGVYDSSNGLFSFNGQLPLNLKLVNQRSFTQPNQDTKEAVTFQNPTFIRKPNLHFCSSALGVMGGVGFIVSCLSSILLPAIASIGVMGIAYLAKRKIISLQAKDLSSEDTKVQNIIKEQANNNVYRNDLIGSTNPEISKLQQNGFGVEEDDDFDDDFDDDEFDFSNRKVSQPEQIVTNEMDDFLKQFQSYISQNNVLNCESLRSALFREDYQTCFEPKQLLEEILSIYKSFLDDRLTGIKINRSDILQYTQSKIEFCENELKKPLYTKESDQEQKKFMSIIHNQAEQEQLKYENDSDKYQFLAKKMTLLGTFFEVLSRYNTLEKKAKEHFSEKSTKAYEYAKQFREKLPLHG